MQPTKCQHKGCKAKHKNPTGFCAEHAADADRQRVAAREGRRCSDPHLIEEYSNIHFPKVI